MPTRHTIDVDGEDLIAVHHAAPSDRWLVFSHGFVSDKSGSYVGRCERASVEGYNAVRFDHRGCGESARSFEEQRLSTRITDLEAVLEYFDPPQCVLFGSSFGGKVVFHTAIEEERVSAVAARAPVTYARNFDRYRPQAAQDLGKMAAAFFDDFDRYAFDSITETLDVPVALFHGREDAVVPITSSLDAVAAFDTDVLFQQYATEGHRFSESAEARLREQLIGWLGSLETLCRDA